jgi:hypothetical protein
MRTMKLRKISQGCYRFGKWVLTKEERAEPGYEWTAETEELGGGEHWFRTLREAREWLERNG